ncbi:MAG: exopolysaccharide biosynthesis protein, partial [Candidatus Methylacidiphilales bacterium]|nr:exopolysaccharide biosynthesis protein [Candidatus Methylacidiphilales bacterium]
QVAPPGCSSIFNFITPTHMTAEAAPDSISTKTSASRRKVSTKKPAASAAKSPAPRVIKPRKPATSATRVSAVPVIESRRASATKSATTPRLRLQDKEKDHARTSQILEEILTKNPGVESFTVEMILRSLGTTSFGTSLMFFAIPEVLPIPLPGVSALVVLPTAVLGAQMASGKRAVRLPDFLLKREVPRRALAAAIYAILPVLRKAETVTRPRWKWATSPTVQRLLGVFVFLLALSIAFPIPGFNMPQAIAIFVIGLGLVEKDGLIICLGVVLGLASLALLGAVVIGLAAFFGF